MVKSWPATVNVAGQMRSDQTGLVTRRGITTGVGAVGLLLARTATTHRARRDLCAVVSEGGDESSQVTHG